MVTLHLRDSAPQIYPDPQITRIALRHTDIGFQIMFLARLEGASLSKAYNEYVVEGGRLITQSKDFIWKTIVIIAIVTNILQPH